MTVTLLHSTPLEVADTAIGKCWDKPTPADEPCNIERIHRVGNKHKHASTLEQLSYNFDIDGISRALLQELARHRMASYSVKSSRYTLKELKHTSVVEDFLVFTGNEDVDMVAIDALYGTQALLQEGISNDIVKYTLPEAYKTSLIWTINARSLQNFLALRTSKAALWEIQSLAYKVYKAIPNQHKFLFEEFINDGYHTKGTK